MASKKAINALAKLEAAKRGFGSGDSNILRSLSALSRSRLTDAESLIRLHETLLFFRAYPPSAKALKLVEQILKTIGNRVSKIQEADVDLAPLDDPEVSGIVGTSVTSNFSYTLVRWLVKEYPARISIDWDWIENEDQMGAILPRFLPLLDDDSMVEAHVPFREWLRAASGRQNELVWLVNRFDSLKLSLKAKSELYDSLKLHITWRFPANASRTVMKLPARKIFFHDQPLIKRREVSLVEELNGPPIPTKRLSRAAGERVLDVARETSAVRYRELHGFTYGDAARVVKAEIGRGTEAFVFGVSPEHRLPLRAYHAALILKNGVPVAYFEGLSIFERMESGFNLYYTFRDGETAWLYARILRLMRQLLGVTVFSIEPYQVGHENEEGIESGAAWFYRKLGFRPVKPELLKRMQAEEQKMKTDPQHRTSARTLRKLATGHMLYETPGALRLRTAREWDRFEVRNIGLAVQRRMAREFGGHAEKIRAHSSDFVRRALGLGDRRAGEMSTKAINDLALVLAMVPNIARWTRDEKQHAARIMFAKAGDDEAVYLKEMQKHALLRASLIRLGSGKLP